MQKSMNLKWDLSRQALGYANNKKSKDPWEWIRYYDCDYFIIKRYSLMYVIVKPKWDISRQRYLISCFISSVEVRSGEDQ